jgi:2-isopropylmalate synthase
MSDTKPNPVRVQVFDTTLRDGEQAPGFSMTTRDKLVLARAIAELGVDVMEAGFAAASPGDLEAIRAVAAEIQGPTICSLSRATEGDLDAAAKALEPARRSRVHIFLGTSPTHREAKLKMTRDQVLERIDFSVGYAAKLFDEVEFSAEDALRTERDFLVEAFERAAAAGAVVLNVPDTVGFTTPDEIYDVFRMLAEKVKVADGVIFSAHCHDDLGMAVANTMQAVRAGARQIECAINGIGERAGNCSLEEAVMALVTRKDVFNAETGIDTRKLYPASRLLARITHNPVPRNKAIVGRNAFAHEAGIHQHGMLADRRTYEIMNAEDVGQPATSLVLGKHSGKHAIQERAKALGYELDQNALDAIFPAFKKVADEAREVTDHQLMELIGGNAAGRKAQPWKLRRVELRAAYGSRTEPFARIELDHEERGRVCDVGIGGGPLDAAFDAIQSIVGITASVQELDITHVADQDDGACLGYIELMVDGHVYSGRARGRDVIPTAVDAYVVAINQALSAGEAGRKGSQADAA